MDQPRDASLAVHKGFWQGITMQNLYTVFANPEARQANEVMLADYNQLFREEFPQCRRDIQSCLPSWAQWIVLTKDPLDDEDDVEIMSESNGLSANSGNNQHVL